VIEYSSAVCIGQLDGIKYYMGHVCQIRQIVIEYSSTVCISQPDSIKYCMGCVVGLG